MKHTNKKGFTIVELVIVIAVIAILAAVLIPTFSNLIKKANISNDTAIAKNLNTAAISAQADTFGQAIEAAKEAGYLVAHLNAKAENIYFVWDDSTNQFLLYDLTNEKVLYSNTKEYSAAGENWYFVVNNLEDKEAVLAAISSAKVQYLASSSAVIADILAAGGQQTIYVDESVQAGDSSFINLNKADANITVDFGKSAIQGGSDDVQLEAFPIYVQSGTLNLTNGVVSATSKWLNSDNVECDGFLYAAPNSTINVNGTVVESNEAISSVFTYGIAKGLIENVTFKTPNGNNLINAGGIKNEEGKYTGSELTVKNCTMDVQYIAVQATYGSSVVIDGGNYHASVSNLLCVNVNGTITVKGGTFACDNEGKTFKFYNFSDNEIVIEGGTFNGVAFENLTADLLKSWCNLSDCAKGVTVTQVNGAWVIAVN